MNNQRGDAGVSMLVVMVVVMFGFWLFPDHSGEHGSGGHHMMSGGTKTESPMQGSASAETSKTNAISSASR